MCVVAGGKFSNSLLKKITKIVRAYAKAACEQVRQEWARHSIEGNEDTEKITFKVEDAEAVVAATIIATGQNAWLYEYGKGSQMEKSNEENPFLEEYISGAVKGGDGQPLFNPERLRKGFCILGRPKGEYRDLDDKTHFATGAIKNWNLELLAPSLKDLQMETLPPRKVIKKVLFGDNAQGGIVVELNKEIDNAVADTAFEMMKAAMPKKITILKE